MVLRVGLVAAALDPPLALKLMPVLAAFGLILASCSAILFYWNATAAKPTLTLTNPLQLAAAIKMAALIAVILAASVILQQHFGDAGLLSLAAISGLADVDAITVSMAELARDPATRDAAAKAVTLAVFVNTGVKAVLAAWLGGKPIGIPVMAASALGICAGSIAYLVL